MLHELNRAKPEGVTICDHLIKSSGITERHLIKEILFLMNFLAVQSLTKCSLNSVSSGDIKAAVPACSWCSFPYALAKYLDSVFA